MTHYDLIDEAFIDAPPAAVWTALVDELAGARAWWTPHNTFEPGATRPDEVGGEVRVTVHAKGVDNGGPKLRFTGRTTVSEPRRRLVTEYYAGVFRGRSEIVLDAVDGGERTRIAFHFTARPHGWLRFLAKVVDIGLQHSKGTQSAFTNLNALVGGRAAVGGRR
ncbi:SRPBCC family protein [Actinokineospora sp. 24-640]